jgi:hypothetical protein
VRELVSYPDHQLVVAHQIPEPYIDRLREAAPTVEPIENWEALLHEPVAHALIVSSHSQLSPDAQEHRADPMRKLTQAGFPMLATFPACESIIGFELEMIRRDVKGLLVPYHPDFCDPILQDLFARLHAEPHGFPLGPLEQVIMERRLASRELSMLRHQLNRDTALIRQLAGGIARVSGLGQAFSPGASPFHLTANFDSPQKTLCSWSLCTTHQPYLARLTLVGAEGQWSLRQCPETHTWAWEEPDSADNAPPVPPPHSAAVRASPSRVILDHFLGLLVPNDAETSPVLPETQRERDFPAESPRESLLAGSSPYPLTWMDACRAQEAAETVERAVARGRTIELFNEEHSEEGTFKGLMAAGSCSILMLTLLVLVAGAIIEGVRLPYARQRERAATREATGSDMTREATPGDTSATLPLWIRLWPVYPLLLFLLLQTLNLVFVPPSKPKADPEAEPPPPGSPPSSPDG